MLALEFMLQKATWLTYWSMCIEPISIDNASLCYSVGSSEWNIWRLDSSNISRARYNYIDWLIAWLIEVSWEKQNRMKVGQINGDKQLRVKKVVVFIILLFRLEVLRYSKAQKL